MANRLLGTNHDGDTYDVIDLPPVAPNDPSWRARPDGADAGAVLVAVVRARQSVYREHGDAIRTARWEGFAIGAAVSAALVVASVLMFF